jgi:murein DD-endopeptidase MepM/ murein hydrolase activator NlpD
MSGPESILAIAAREVARHSPDVPATPAPVGSPSAARRGVPIGPVFDRALATARALSSAAPAAPVDGAWTIPWAEGAAPVQHVARSGAPQAVAGPGVAGQATPIRPAAASTPAAEQATGTPDDPLAVVWPLKGRISQRFGPTTSKYSVPHTVNGVYYEHFHDGIDIAAPVGRPVKAIAAGKVVFAGTYPDGAEVIRVKHADGTIALYAHLDRDPGVRVGDKVAPGEAIGTVGSNGKLSGPHLHLELLSRKGVDLDPLKFLQSGHLPGRPNGRLDSSVLGATPVSVTSDAALTRFDAVAHRIPFAAEIRSAAVKAGIDPLLLASLVKAESSFHPNSVSRAGAMGLCQLMPATAKAMKVENPFDPAQNLRAGAKYLATNLRIFGRVDLALAAYQAGKGAVRAAGYEIPDSPTTRHYVNRILRSWAGYLEAAA